MPNISPMSASLLPVTEDERYAQIDILRGGALLGVLLVNLLISFRVSLLHHLVDFHTHPGRANQAVDLLLGILVEEKAITLFSFLFGVSMAIHVERSRTRGERYLPVALRRLLGLLAIGAFHLVFIWNGDILMEYALAGCVTLPALWLPRRWGLGTALALLILTTLPVPLPLPHVDWVALRGHVEAATRVYASGGYREIFLFRQHETAVLFFPLLCGILPRTVGVMLLGQYVWRCGLLRSPQTHRALLRWVAGLGIPLGILVNISMAAMAYSHRSLGAFEEVVHLLSILPMSAGYVALLLLLLLRPPVRQALSGAGAVGRMALSCYLTQSVVLGFLFYGYGLGLFGRLGAAVTAPLGFALFGLQMAGSLRWLGRYQFGPVEWLWRSMTYRRLQPLRRPVEKTR
jgi:uncharacterized protein